jgi:hypothetical protein
LAGLQFGLHSQGNFFFFSPLLLRFVPSLLSRAVQYGKAFRTQIGGSVTVKVSHPPSLEYVQKTNFKNYVKGSELHEIFEPFLGDGIFNVDGKPHHFLCRCLFCFFFFLFSGHSNNFLQGLFGRNNAKLQARSSLETFCCGWLIFSTKTEKL